VGRRLGTRRGARRPHEAAVAAGALERAETWLRRFEERAGRSRIPWSLAVSARCRGLLLAARGELDNAAEALERSLRAHEHCPVPFERARTLLVHGQVLRRMKKKREARASLEQARTIFEQLGSDAWVGRAAAELQRVAVRKAPDELSATELRIAQLAAAGFSIRRSRPRFSSRERPSRRISRVRTASSASPPGHSSVQRSTGRQRRFRRDLPLSSTRRRT
jgi:tetratricopeptide (TPR) repeat protein